MNTLHERNYIGDIVRTEMPNYQSRRTGTIPMGNVLKAGTILGIALLGLATASAFPINAADTGTIDTVTVSDGAKVGEYKVVIIEPATNAGAFSVEGPDGVTIGTGTVGVEFEGGGLTFTVADGATDFKSGEGFTITVAEGTGEHKVPVAGATDGSGVGTDILLQDVDATDGAVHDVVFLYRDAQIAGDYLIFDESIDSPEAREAVLKGLIDKDVILLPSA